MEQFSEETIRNLKHQWLIKHNTHPNITEDHIQIVRPTPNFWNPNFLSQYLTISHQATPTFWIPNFLPEQLMHEASPQISTAQHPTS